MVLMVLEGNLVPFLEVSNVGESSVEEPVRAGVSCDVEAVGLELSCADNDDNDVEFVCFTTVESRFVQFIEESIFESVVLDELIMGSAFERIKFVVKVSFVVV